MDQEVWKCERCHKKGTELQSWQYDFSAYV